MLVVFAGLEMARRVSRFLEERPVRYASEQTSFFCHLALWQSVCYAMHVDDEYQEHYVSAVSWISRPDRSDMVSASKYNSTGSLFGECITFLYPSPN